MKLNLRRTGDVQAKTVFHSEWESLEVPLLGHPQQTKVTLFHPQGKANDGAPGMKNYISSREGASGCLESLHGMAG